MSVNRAFWFGVACFVTGWLAAGSLEFYDAPLWAIVLVLLASLFVIAAVADWLGRRDPIDR